MEVKKVLAGLCSLPLLGLPLAAVVFLQNPPKENQEHADKPQVDFLDYEVETHKEFFCEKDQFDESYCLQTIYSSLSDFSIEVMEVTQTEADFQKISDECSGISATFRFDLEGYFNCAATLDEVTSSGMENFQVGVDEFYALGLEVNSKLETPLQMNKIKAF